MHQADQRPRGGNSCLLAASARRDGVLGGLSLNDSGGEVAKALCCLLNVGL
jgi:hypothetical protein